MIRHHLDGRGADGPIGPGPASGSRSGITLTEILISILIMGVGLISLATLFPLGLVRLREAQRDSRSTLWAESAAAETQTRDLFNKASYLNLPITWYGANPTFALKRDPWIQDLAAGGSTTLDNGNYRGLGGDNDVTQPNPLVTSLDDPDIIPGPGLPVCYDPLWRATVGVYPNNTTNEARFASGIGLVRDDPNGGGVSTTASAHGLQRLSNFPATLAANDAVGKIFASPDDIVFTDMAGPQAAKGRSPLVPDLDLGSTSTATRGILADWSYTWMFTGQQADSTNGSVYDGNVVVFHNRPFGLDSVNVDGKEVRVPSGERVVEGIFGYGKTPGLPLILPNGDRVGYGSSDKTVLLRWPSTLPDPEIRTGGWIADVTYERNRLVEATRLDPTYPMIRCYWYQIVRRTQAAAEVAGMSAPLAAGYRRMTVEVGTKLRAKTLLNYSASSIGTPYHVNAALIIPSVVNVFPRTFYSR